MNDLIGKNICIWCNEVEPKSNHHETCAKTFKPKKYNYGWIKCSDRLPDKYKDLLAFGNEGIIIAQYYGVDWGGWATSMNKSTDNITHWQPLPAPPENINE